MQLRYYDNNKLGSYRKCRIREAAIGHYTAAPGPAPAVGCVVCVVSGAVTAAAGAAGVSAGATAGFSWMPAIAGPVEALAFAARMAAYSIRPKILAIVRSVNAIQANATIAVAVFCCPEIRAIERVGHLLCKECQCPGQEEIKRGGVQ